MILIAARTGILHDGLDDSPGAVVVLAATGVGDLDLAAAERGDIPRRGQRDDQVAVRVVVTAGARRAALVVVSGDSRVATEEKGGVS